MLSLQFGSTEPIGKKCLSLSNFVYSFVASCWLQMSTSTLSDRWLVMATTTTTTAATTTATTTTTTAATTTSSSSSSSINLQPPQLSKKSQRSLPCRHLGPGTRHQHGTHQLQPPAKVGFRNPSLVLGVFLLWGDTSDFTIFVPLEKHHKNRKKKMAKNFKPLYRVMKKKN